jgi:hypothetical protein
LRQTVSLITDRKKARSFDGEAARSCGGRPAAVVRTLTAEDAPGRSLLFESLSAPPAVRGLGGARRGGTSEVKLTPKGAESRRSTRRDGVGRWRLS